LIDNNTEEHINGILRAWHEEVVRNSSVIQGLCNNFTLDSDDAKYIIHKLCECMRKDTVFYFSPIKKIQNIKHDKKNEYGR
jgi:hypothetical protein